MERQSKGSRGLEAYCKGGQGPPRAVAPSKKKKKKTKKKNIQFLAYYAYTMGVSKLKEKLNVICEFSKDQFQIE
jgi:hypothetical protein